MRFKFIVLILLFIYFFVGIGSFYHNYINNKLPNSYQIHSFLQKKLKEATSINDVIQESKNLFLDYIHVGGIFFTTLDSEIIHYVYEKEKVSFESLNNIKDQIVGITKDIITHDKFFILKNIDEDKDIIIFSILLKGISPYMFFMHLYSYYEQFPWFLLGYCIIGFILLIIVLVLIFSSNSSANRMSMASSEQSYLDKVQYSISKIDSAFNQNLLHINYLVRVLNALFELFHCKKVTYFRWLKGKGFEPVYQKYGEVYVKMEQISQIPDILTSITDLEKWKKILKTPDSKTIIIPIYNTEVYLGVFLVEFGDTQLISNKFIDQSLGIMEQLSTSFAQHIYVHNMYQNAIVDRETGLFTYPYFYFTLKERLLGNNKVAVLIFEVVDMYRYSLGSISQWTREIFHIVYPSTDKKGFSSLLESQKREVSQHAACRLDRQRFAIIFHYALEESQAKDDMTTSDKTTIPLKGVLDITENIYKRGVEIFGSNLQLEGGVVTSVSNTTKDLEFFLKRLELALHVSKSEGSYGSVFN